MLPKHHKTSFFLKAGLFNNLSSFAELEKRISKLPTKKDIEEMEQQLDNDSESLIKASQEQDGNNITALSRSAKQTQACIDTLYKQLEETTEKYEQEKLAFEQEESSL